MAVWRIARLPSLLEMYEFSKFNIDAGVVVKALQLKHPVAGSHTPCMALYALLERALQDGDHDPYDNDIVQIGNVLMACTTSFGMLFVVLDERLEQRDYAGALQVGVALVEHEAMLLDVACGKPVQYASTVN